MNASARPWLPANAVRDERLAAALAVHGRNWVRCWFGAERAVNVRMNEVKSRSALANDTRCWSDRQGGLLLCMAPGAHTPIAMGLLGLETGAHRIGASDHAVLRDLAAQAAADFLASASDLLSVEGVMEAPAKEVHTGFRFALGLGAASQVLELFVEEARATAARKRLAGAQANARLKPPRPRADAVARQEIRVSAMIGAGKLGLGELRTLARGDILLLDRGPDDAVDLAVNGAVRARALARLVKQSEELRMRIEPSGLPS